MLVNTKITARPETEPLPNLPPVLEQKLGPIQYIQLDQLTAYHNNPRKHPERQIVQLMASMREFGFTMPVLIDADNVIIAGHARVEAARRIGVTEIPTLIADHWSRAQVKAYRLADNRLSELGDWNVEALRIELQAIIQIGEVHIEALGWSTGEIDVMMSIGPVGDGPDPADEVPAAPQHPVARIGDIWRLGKHRLLCGSSLEGEAWQKLMAGQTAAMAFVDGPYNVPINGHVSGKGKARHAEFSMATGEMNSSEFVNFNQTYLTRMTEYLKDGAVVMACMDHRHIGELMTAAQNVGLKHLNLCVWKKTNGGMGSLYRSQHELVLVLKHGTARHTNNVELGKHGRYRTNVWEYAGVNCFSASRDQDLADHPTVKPITLVADAIRDVTQQHEIVIDAFSGSGTTILACERTDRVGYAIEIEPKYIDVAIRRWEDMTGLKATLDGTAETIAEVRVRRAAEDTSSAAPETVREGC